MSKTDSIILQSMSKGIRTVKKSVYVVTIWLKEEDAEGSPLNWSSPSEDYYADTYEQAQQLKEKFMSGQHEDYGDLVEDCWISDEKKEIEFMVPVEKKASVLGSLHKKQERIKAAKTVKEEKSEENRSHEKNQRGGER